jgi:hypothetical protein
MGNLRRFRAVRDPATRAAKTAAAQVSLDTTVHTVGAYVVDIEKLRNGCDALCWREPLGQKNAIGDGFRALLIRVVASQTNNRPETRNGWSRHFAA